MFWCFPLGQPRQSDCSSVNLELGGDSWSPNSTYLHLDFYLSTYKYKKDIASQSWTERRGLGGKHKRDGIRKRGECEEETMAGKKSVDAIAISEIWNYHSLHFNWLTHLHLKTLRGIKSKMTEVPHCCGLVLSTWCRGRQRAQSPRQCWLSHHHDVTDTE